MRKARLPMPVRVLALLVLGLGLQPGDARAVATEDFLVADTQDVVDICTTSESDPLYTAAIAFCHGYLVGAYQYHAALFGAGKSKPVVCFPDPPPTRTQAVDRFIAWVKVDPARGKERPADALTQYLVESFPCAHAAAK
jgi:hypothetical protein